jgi:hypothetical protein
MISEAKGLSNLSILRHRNDSPWMDRRGVYRFRMVHHAGSQAIR